MVYAPIRGREADQLGEDGSRHGRAKKGTTIKCGAICAQVIYLEDPVNTTRAIMGNGETIVSIRTKNLRKEVIATKCDDGCNVRMEHGAGNRRRTPVPSEFFG